MNAFQWFKDYMNGHPLRWMAWYFIVMVVFIVGFGISVTSAA